MKNEITTGKNWTKYKVSNFRYFDKTKGMAIGGTIHYVYVYADKIRIVRYIWRGKETKDSSYITIKYVKGNFILSKQGQPTSFQCINCLFEGKKWVFGQVHLKRLEKIFKNWCESLGHTYKCSKTPEITKTFGKLIYPSIQRREYSLDEFIHPKVKVVGSLLRRYLSLKEVIKRLIGSCGKKTYKLVCERIKKDGLGPALDRLWRMKQIFKLDDIQKIMEKNLPVWHSIPTTCPSNRNVLLLKPSLISIFTKQFSKRQLLSENVVCFGFFFDSLRMWLDLERPAIPSDWSMMKAHDEFARIQRSQRDKPFDLNPADFLKEVDGSQISGYTIRIPHTSSTLRDWGEKMHNCISGYGTQMRDGHVHLFGVEEDGEIKYNVMLRKREKFNTRNDKEDAAVYAMMGLNEDIGKAIKPKHKEIYYECSQFYGKCNSLVHPSIIRQILQSFPVKIQWNMDEVEWDEVQRPAQPVIGIGQVAPILAQDRFAQEYEAVFANI